MRIIKQKLARILHKLEYLVYSEKEREKHLIEAVFGKESK